MAFDPPSAEHELLKIGPVPGYDFLARLSHPHIRPLPVLLAGLHPSSGPSITRQCQDHHAPEHVRPVDDVGYNRGTTWTGVNVVDLAVPELGNVPLAERQVV